jgi:chorismate mutase
MSKHTAGEWRCRGVRGATTCPENTAASILAATEELLRALIAANNIQEQDVASAIFTTTPDLNAVYPAAAARTVGWRQIALLGAQEIAAPNAISRCIRILIHWNTPKTHDQIQHVYMHGAEKLRPDWYPENKIVIEDQKS